MFKKMVIVLLALTSLNANAGLLSLGDEGTAEVNIGFDFSFLAAPILRCLLMQMVS